MRLIIDDVRHLKLRENLLWLGTITLVTVLIWIFYSIYAAFTKPFEDPQIAGLLKPFNPELDQEAITLLGEEVVPPADFTIINQTALNPAPYSQANASKPVASAAAEKN